MPGRSYTATGSYRYGFNGKENDKDMHSTTLQDYGFRIYSPGIGRFLSVDPLAAKYPYYTPYQFAGNMPIRYIDLDGLEPAEPGTKVGERSTGTNGKSDVATTWEWDGKSWNEAQLSEVIVNSGPSKVPIKPITPEYFEKFQKTMNKGSTIRMLKGLSTVGNRLFGSPYDPYKITKLKEQDKQDIFKQSADKTIAILFYEFVEGTGSQRRDFDEATPITQQIGNSYTTSLFFDYFYPLYQSGAFNDGVERMHTVFTSPDNANSAKESIKAHGQLFWNLSAFFTGSLDYYFKVDGKKLVLRVHNEFSISSGDPQSRNKADDLHRVPGHDSPLGSTEQYFNFSVDLDKLKRN